MIGPFLWGVCLGALLIKFENHTAKVIVGMFIGCLAFLFLLQGGLPPL